MKFGIITVLLAGLAVLFGAYEKEDDNWLYGDSVQASWYGPGYHGSRAANGSIYDMTKHTLAHKELPFGTVVEFYNPETNLRSRGTITDRGPFIEGRDFDLSAKMAEELGFKEKGLAWLKVRIIRKPDRRT